MINNLILGYQFVNSDGKSEKVNTNWITGISRPDTKHFWLGHEIKVWWPKISSIPTRIKPVIGSASSGHTAIDTAALSPGAKTLCSAHQKQNPSELKVDSSPLNHQRTRDFQPQKKSRDFLILYFFSVRKDPLLSRSRIHPEGVESSRIQNRHVVGGGPRYYHSGWRLSFLGPAIGGV